MNSTGNYGEHLGIVELEIMNNNEKYRAEEIKDIIRLYANKDGFIEKAYVNRWKKAVEVYQ